MVCAMLAMPISGRPMRGRCAARMPAGTPAAIATSVDRATSRSVPLQAARPARRRATTRNRTGAWSGRAGWAPWSARQPRRGIRARADRSSATTTSAVADDQTRRRRARRRARPSANASAMSCVTISDGLPQVALDALELALQLGSRDRIERAERLVHQQHRRIGGQRARHADTLALPARQLVRPACRKVGRRQADELEQLRRARARRGAGHPSSRGTP